VVYLAFPRNAPPFSPTILRAIVFSFYALGFCKPTPVLLFSECSRLGVLHLPNPWDCWGPLAGHFGPFFAVLLSGWPRVLDLLLPDLPITDHFRTPLTSLISLATRVLSVLSYIVPRPRLVAQGAPESFCCLARAEA